MKPPVQALNAWKMRVPDLFVKNVRNHPGPDSQVDEPVLDKVNTRHVPQTNGRPAATNPRLVTLDHFA